ncbi:MAG: PLP-dependent aminotransferase family protein [Candidatus Bathyarchaeota archaeon]|nr:MAG: PLP-dependent aminotransferase family protein [Candidatus Bathyarchaeota archaeon]
MDADKFYSELGRSQKPGVLTKVVLAAVELMKQGKKIISMTGGSYDPSSVPYKQIKEIIAGTPTEEWQEILQYGAASGKMELRREISGFMAGHGITADPKGEIIVTSGSQQALDLVSRVFLNPGDVILVGSPTYLAALGAFKQYNPELRSVVVDGDGMSVEALEVELNRIEAEGKWAKLLYVVPSFQNPTGSMLTKERRRRVLELAEEHDFLVLEDNAYGYINFGGEMPTPIKGLDRTGRVMYTSTFSKIVSPGLRIGWLAGSREFIGKIVEAKGKVNICNDGVTQYIAAELFRRGDVEKQIPMITRVYRRKRDLMLEAMETSFPEEAEWKEPKGGLFLWVSLPERVDATEMLTESLNRGVAYVPGSNFFAEPVHNYIRLNYSFPSEPDIVEGIQILGGLLKEKL